MTEFIGMTSKIFAEFLHRNISFTAVALAIIVGRMVLKRFPKRYSYALWSCLGIRALFDIGLRIKLPKLTAPQTGSNLGNTINSAVVAGQQYIFEIGNIDTSAPVKSALTAKEILPTLLFTIWAAGVLLMIVYGIINFLKVKKATAVSFKEDSGLYRCDYIESPIAFGFVKPKVFIPSDCDVRAMRFVIEHEKTHIRRGDVYFKLLAFLILSAYWVNPLAWVAFKLFNLDMELSCDEAVIRKAGIDKKEEYSRWLLYYSTENHPISLAPTAFGETDTKRRVRNIMTLKKKGIIATVAGLTITAAVVAICFILNPGRSNASAPETTIEPISETTETIAETPGEEPVVATEPAAETALSDEEVPSADKELTQKESDLTDSEIEERKQKLEAVTWISPFGESVEYVITSLFGEKSNGIDGATLFHGAVDIAAPTGTELLAVSDGTVSFAGYVDQAGNTLTVNVKDDVAYRYSHLEEILVKEGDTVKAGDVIAKLGSTGASTGPHLHLELVVDGKYYFDPLAYVPIKADTRTGADE
ncbi:MAG: peptidoglycan DD-metalloendopeptidase family protein [Lachnospiraceae bacterium]|nr:peptidoglycan DD-metalloendopeptidase family protein [Lachnospiraceae bacterium]